MTTRALVRAVMALSWTACSLAMGQDVESQQSRRESDVKAALSTIRAIPVGTGNFVAQSEVDPVIREGGGGGCASAAAIDALQLLLVMAGKDPLTNPHRAVLASFDDQRELLNGRVTNDQLRKTLSFYDERFLSEATITCEITSAMNSKYASNGKAWAARSGPDLEMKPNQVRIVSYSISPQDSEPLGRHFVLLIDSNADGITVLDPARPEKDYKYAVRFQSGDNGPRERVFLERPTGVAPSAHVYEINTVFTFSIAHGEAGKSVATSSLTVEQAKERISIIADQLEGTDDYLSPRAWRKKGGQFGLPALDLPKVHGGRGWTASQMFEVFRHAGRFNLNFRDVVGAAHGRVLLKSNNPAVLDIVKQVGRGDGYIAIAITEPDVGSNVRGIKSKAVKVDGGYLLTGTKRFNARLEQASHVIIFTQGITGKLGRLSVFVVPIDHKGLKHEPLKAHGLTGNSYGGIAFSDMFVPTENMIGADGEGLSTFFEHFLYWRLMQTAAAIGTGEQALEQMANRLKKREAFGGPIGRFTHLQQQLGQSTMELKMATALAQEAARRIDEHGYSDDELRAIICGLKAEGVEAALRAVDVTMRAFGGEGYSDLVDVGDRLRDLQGLRIADGTTDVMRMDVVRHIYGQEFWDMAVGPRKE